MESPRTYSQCGNEPPSTIRGQTQIYTSQTFLKTSFQNRAEGGGARGVGGGERDSGGPDGGLLVLLLDVVV